MAGEVAIKKFSGGMNKDVDYSLLKDTQYTDAQNYRLISDSESNNFILENAAGNTSWLDISGVSGLDDTYFLVGQAFVRPYLILFFTTNENDRTPTAGTSKIVRVTIDKDLVQEVNIIYDDSAVTGVLGLSATYPITAIANYEAEDNIKVYWTDEYNPVRMINIMDENLSTYTPGMLDIVPDFPMNSAVQIRPEIDDTLVEGALPVCAVQYAYQYYIDKGVSTLWSPPSPLQVIHAEGEVSSFSDCKGGDVGETTPYGVKFTIHIPSENLYSNIRVVAIQYNSYDAVPTIRIVRDTELTTATTYDLEIIDIGQSLGELVYEEFAISNNVSYRCKDIATKDNRLFLANIREELFDIDDGYDCRVYRFDNGGTPTAKIFEDDLTTSLDVTAATYSNVSADHDCINRYNNIDDEFAYKGYEFQSDGLTLGAEGPNIAIEFSTNDHILDTLLTDNTTGTIDNITCDNGDSTMFEAGKKSFQRQEVYRLGIIFRNGKLQASTAKWMCDLKMPTYTDTGGAHISTVGSNPWAVKLGIQVTVSNFANTGASTWEIVMVPRETSLDRSVLGQGILQPGDDQWTTYYQHSGYYMDKETPVNPNSDWDTVVWFCSPEVSFNNNLEYVDGDFFQKVGYFAADANWQLLELGAYESYHYKLYDFTAQDGAYRTNEKEDILGGKILPVHTSQTDVLAVGDQSVSNYHYDPVGTPGNDGPGTWTYAAEWSNPSADFIDQATGGSKVPLVNYRRNSFLTQYGGPTYLNRLNNTYISISDLKQSNTSVVTYEGDVYIDFWSQIRQTLDIPTTASNCATFLFPLESTIATRLNHSDSIYRYPTNPEIRLTQQFAGEYTGVINTTTYTLNQEVSLFQYNPVYSQLNKTIVYPIETDYFETINNYSLRIIASEQKINNETIDSFTKFGTSNFIDVDGTKGPINSLDTFKNQLFFWQTTGFGIASVNTRSIIEDNQPGVLVLGTGGVLDRVDYISETIGNQNQFGIAKSESGMYWIDNNRNEFFKYDGKLKSLSKLEGIQTWVNNQGKIGDAEVVFDSKYNDILFTISFSRILDCQTASGGFGVTYLIDDDTDLPTDLYNVKVKGRFEEDTLVPYKNVFNYNTTTNVGQLSEDPYATTSSFYYITFQNEPTFKYTISFNERTDSFVSFHSFEPYRYIEIPGHLLSTDDGHDIYIHNSSSAARSTYYGVEFDSEFTTVFNKDFPFTKVWDTLRWYSESVDSNGDNQFKDIFADIHMYNDYQHTGPRNLYYKGAAVPGTYPSEVVRRDRTFSMHIPRSVVDENVSTNPDIFVDWDESQYFKERMRDKYLVVRTIYDNSNGYIFSIPYMNAIYRKSRR